MRVWIDMTASAHPLVFRPLVSLLEARGDEVEITARDYAQTLQLIEQHGHDRDDDRASRRALSARRRRGSSPRGSGRSGGSRRAATSTSRSRTARTS